MSSRNGNKILHIITGLQSGGAERILYSLVTTQSELQHCVLSLTKGGMYLDKLKKSGVEVEQLDLKNGSLVRQIFSLMIIIKKKRPQIVQSWLIHADLLSCLVKMLNPKIILFWNIRHSNYPFNLKNLNKLLMMAILVCLSRFFPKNIFTCANSIKRLYTRIGMKEEKFIVIPNGVQLDFVANKPAALNRPKNKQFTIAFIARAHEQKNHLGLITAIRRLTERGTKLKIIFVGSGTKKIAKQHASDLKNIIYAYDEVSDPSKIIESCDASILPSIYGEGFPNVLIESMSKGVPCISSDCGDAAQIIGNTGWVFRLGNQSDLEKAIHFAYVEWNENPVAYDERSFKAIKRVQENFLVSKMSSSYLDFYRDSLRNN